MKLDEIQYIECVLFNLSVCIGEAREWCSAHFPRNKEVSKRIHTLMDAYKRLEETLTLEAYKEARK